MYLRSVVLPMCGNCVIFYLVLIKSHRECKFSLFPDCIFWPKNGHP